MHPDPTRLITFRDFLDNRQCLDCYCPGCRRTAWTDVEMLVRNGFGESQCETLSPALPEVRQRWDLEFHWAIADLCRRDLDAIKKPRREAEVRASAGGGGICDIRARAK